MNKKSMMKKSLVTGLTFIMVLGGSTAALAHGNNKDQILDKSSKENSIQQNSSKNSASVLLLGFPAESRAPSRNSSVDYSSRNHHIN